MTKTATPAAPAKGTGKITTVKHDSGGTHVCVTDDTGATFALKKSLETAEFGALAQIGKPFAKAKAMADKLLEASKTKSPGKLANGLDGRNAPNSAKAVRDNVAAGKPAPAAKPAKAEAKTAAKTTAKAKVEERKEARKVTDKAIKPLLKVADIKTKPDSFRYAMLKDLLTSKTVAEFYARDKKTFNSRYDAGCVRFAVASKYVEIA